MNWESRYLPPDSHLWQGRVDAPNHACFYQKIRLFNLLHDTFIPASQTTFALLGFKCDEGARRDLGRTGASEGPIAIRQRLARLPLQHHQFICYDMGDILCADHDLEASQRALGEVVALLKAHRTIPILIGGGHELAQGQFQGIAEHYPADKRLGIINFDAHFNLQPTHPNHRASVSTVFYEIAHQHQQLQRHLDYNCIGIQHVANIRQAFEIAKKFHAHYILADDLHQGLQEKCFDFIDRVIDQNDMIYMSLALDVFSPAFAPGVSSIQPLGLDPWHLIPFIRLLAASGKVVTYDIAEHVPLFDIDHRTAKLAASLIYEIMHHHHESYKT